MGLLDVMGLGPNLTDQQRTMRGGILSAIGQGLSQYDAGEPVNLSPAFDALNQRVAGMKMRQALDSPDLLAGFTPQQRQLIAALPPETAMQVITNNAFAPAPESYTQSTIGQIAAQRGLQVPEGVDPNTMVNVGPDGKITQVGGGGTVINNNMGSGGIDYGDPPSDMAWLRNPDGSVKLDPNGVPQAALISGSPSDSKRVQDISKMAGDAIAAGDKAGAVASAQAVSSDVIISAAERARMAAEDRSATGLSGKVASFIPGTASAEVYRQVDVLRSNATIEALSQMRAQSPTGGALGNVTEGEGKMLADKAGALDPASPNFLRDLDDYERTLLRVIHGNADGDRIYNSTRGAKNDGTATTVEDDPLGLFK